MYYNELLQNKKITDYVIYASNEQQEEKLVFSISRCLVSLSNMVDENLWVIWLPSLIQSLDTMLKHNKNISLP